MKSIDTTRIDLLGLDRVLKRGTGEIILNEESALLIRDQVSGACLLACDEIDTGIYVLDRYLPPECGLLMVSDYELGKTAFDRYGFSDKLECYQVAYYGAPPVPDDRLSIRTADKTDLPLLWKNYHLISEEEMEEVVKRGSLLLGYCGDRLVGFMGEHLEGSMGLLYIFPEFRRRGYATALEKAYIARTMEAGFVPFGQVEKSNQGSLLLQEKIGMLRSQNLICWMWK